MIYLLIAAILFLLLYKKPAGAGNGNGEEEQPPPPPPSEVTWNDVENAENIKLVLIGGYKVQVLLLHWWVYHNIYSISLPSLLNFLRDFSFEAGESAFSARIESTPSRLTITYMKFKQQGMGVIRTGPPSFLPINDRFPGRSARNGWVLESIGTYSLKAKDVKEGINKALGVIGQMLSEDGYKLFEWRNICLKVKLEKPA